MVAGLGAPISSIYIEVYATFYVPTRVTLYIGNERSF